VALVLQPMDMTLSIGTAAWMKDLLLDDKRGRFIGIRIIL